MTITVDVPQDPEQEVVVPVDVLQDVLVKMLVRKGMFEAEALIAAQRMIEADLRGIHSHGSRAMLRYLDHLDDGDIDPRAQILTIKETPAIAVMDGSDGMGHVAATKAMELAIQKASEVGTGTVAVKHSKHYGAASVYALMAVEAGMIGFTTTSTAGATVAAYGSSQPATANNAIAWGVPTRTGTPFVLDMACAESSWGKVETLKYYGGTLPEGWALDSEGSATTDPAAAKTLLPASGARGYGLAFLSSVLAGPLAGGKMPLHKTKSPSVEASEHFFYVIDLKQFVDPDRFYEECDQTISEIRAMPPAAGFDKVRTPGEIEWERAENWKINGIPMHGSQVKRLQEAAQSMKIDFSVN